MSIPQIIAPSVLNANFLELGKSLSAIEKGGAGLIHLDIMDGHFVPNISFGPGIADNIKKGTSVPLDCHLMITNPDNYV
jgi:ribulose-phosphate 3-epimerase